jgi:hypothetical protein
MKKITLFIYLLHNFVCVILFFRLNKKFDFTSYRGIEMRQLENFIARISEIFLLTG